ncbi:MAG: ABC transporter ATP-binding protein/permease [Coriobacteriales bacterium]|nr:ABC transporter ATP-binding protein/permease [Coriobacteriales bacterium]
MPPHGRGVDMSAKAKDSKGALLRLLAYFKSEIPRVIIVLICAIVATVFDVISPKKLGEATTLVFNGARDMINGVAGASIDFEGLQQILVIVFILYFVSSLFLYLQNFCLARLTQNIVYRLRHQIEEKFHKLPLSYYDKVPRGELMSRMVNDVDLISSTISDSIAQALSSVITLIGVCIVMFIISPLLAIIVLVSLPVTFFISAQFAKISKKYYSAQQNSLGDLNAHIEESFTAHSEIKSFNKQKEKIKEFEEANNKYFNNARMAQFVSSIIMPISVFVSNLVYILICLVGAMQVIAGNISPGDIQAFLQYSRNFSRPISQIASIFGIIQATLAAAERVFELLDEEEEIEFADSDSDYFIDAKGNVSFNNIVFSYDKKVDVIKDFSIEVLAGQKVAIVGPTGAGKTTIVNLLMRFYDIDSGDIKLDNKSIYKTSRVQLRQNFGMVLQDCWLFSGTVADNLLYGNENASINEAIECCKAINAHDFIMNLHDGYDTIIDEHASNISHGQRQLLTIARAMLANPKVLILDEATSSIDSRSELIVQEAMAKLCANKTTFIIAHRLSTIKSADIILVLNKGNIVESGNHESLLQADGFYAHLYNSQFAECKDEIE